MKFKDAYRAANDSVHVRDTLKAQIQERYERETASVPQARENRRRWFVAIPTAVAAAAAVFVAVFVGIRAGAVKNAAPMADGMVALGAVSEEPAE